MYFVDLKADGGGMREDKIELGKCTSLIKLGCRR